MNQRIVKEHNSSTAQVKPEPAAGLWLRTIQEGPFCWQAKEAMRKIRDGLDGAHAVTSGLAVYCALSEISSDEQSPAFITTQAWIALKCGLGVRTVGARLKDLERLKLIRIEDTPWQGPANYALLKLGNGCAPSSNGCGRIRNIRKQASLPRSEESPKNLRTITKGGHPPTLRSKTGGKSALQPWQLSRDESRLTKQIHEIEQSSNPDKDLLAGLKANLEEVRAQLRAIGKQYRTSRTSKPKAAIVINRECPDPPGPAFGTPEYEALKTRVFT